MDITFPCGLKERADYCPDFCEYGEFCKLKDKKVEPRGLVQEGAVEEKDGDDKVPEVEIY